MLYFYVLMNENETNENNTTGLHPLRPSAE